MSVHQAVLRKELCQRAKKNKGLSHGLICMPVNAVMLHGDYAASDTGLHGKVSLLEI